MRAALPRSGRPSVLALLPGLLLLLPAGCQREPPPRLAPVTGRVLYRDRPVAGAAVEFLPESDEAAAPSSSGATNADGVFVLRCPPYGAGAVVGSHRVSVVLSPGGQTVPARYASPLTTPLRVEVPAGGRNDLVLILAD
jgi:hypothetical protein